MARNALFTLMVLSAFVLLSIVVIAPAFASVTSVTTIPVGAPNPLGIAVNSVTNKIYETNNGDSSVSVIDGITNAVTIIPVGSSTSAPSNVAVNELTNKIYVTLAGDGTVVVIDGLTNTVSAPITVGAFPDPAPVAIAVNKVTNKIYVANNAENSVSVIDGITNAVTTIPVGSSTSGPGGIAVDESTNKIYVTLNSDGTVVVIDGITNAVTTIPVGNGPGGIAVNSVTNKIYVTSSPDNTVVVIDGITNAVTTIPLAGSSAPSAITANEGNNTMYVTLVGNDAVVLIDGSSNAISAPITVGSNNGPPVPLGDAFNPVTAKLYVTNYNDDIDPNAVPNIIGSVTIVSFSGGTAPPPPPSTPLLKKQNAITSLQTLTPVNNDDKHDLKEAIATLTKSVDGRLWQADGIHLNIKTGDKVFDYEEKTTRELMEIIKHGKESQSFNTSIQSDINMMVDADKNIATAAITDASAKSGKYAADQVVQAQKDMIKATNENNTGKYDQAIDSYEDAWKHAQNALKGKNTESDDDGHNHSDDKHKLMEEWKHIHHTEHH